MAEGTFGFADFGYAEYPYYEAELTNRGDAPSGIVEFVVDWFDENGGYVDDTTEELVSLSPGETWVARSYNVLNDEEVASAEGSGTYGYELPAWPDGLEVVSSELLSGEENVKVRATVRNDTGRTVDYVAFYGKLYDVEMRVLGQVWTNETDLTDGSSWRAEREWDDRVRSGLVESHDVVLEGNTY
ncbi:FxLYD domain-containing protein [Halobaculum sp. EA56]|uniref:FxLYD domain-containing protein n=1 Tax=Halobaculum sp. EA56 TaxID=3421648 RepID=UPI003EB74C1B